MPTKAGDKEVVVGVDQIWICKACHHNATRLQGEKPAGFGHSHTACCNPEEALRRTGTTNPLHGWGLLVSVPHDAAPPQDDQLPLTELYEQLNQDGTLKEIIGVQPPPDLTNANGKRPNPYANGDNGSEVGTHVGLLAGPPDLRGDRNPPRPPRPTDCWLTARARPAQIWWRWTSRPEPEPARPPRPRRSAAARCRWGRG